MNDLRDEVVPHPFVRCPDELFEGKKLDMYGTSVTESSAIATSIVDEWRILALGLQFDVDCGVERCILAGWHWRL